MGPEPGDCPAETAVRAPQSGPGPMGPPAPGVRTELLPGEGAGWPQRAFLTPAAEPGAV